MEPEDMQVIRVIDIGNSVVCDGCGNDYTESDESGGILFGSSAYCPGCAPGIEESARKYSEEENIGAVCPPGVSFREWVLAIRDGNNTITISTSKNN